MKTRILKLMAIVLLLVLVNCDRSPCETDNPIFLSNEYKSKAYQNELAKEIERIGLNNLRFWLADYFSEANKHYFIFYTQNKDLCAKTVIRADESNQSIAKLIERQGKGRFNAEFKNLEFEITTDVFGDVEFIYLSHDKIID